jgi:predicted component of type VI protein secretion system
LRDSCADDMLAPVAGELNLEVIEGPDAGKQISVDRAIVIGRDAGSDLVLEDGEVSGQHARITPSPDGSATVEDLESTNGTFVNQNELMGPARLDPGDELLVGISVIQLRTRQDIASRASAVIQIPPAMAMAPREPTYVNPEVRRVDDAPASAPKADVAHPTVDKYLDVKVRRRAQLAPLALLTLVAIALILYFSLGK